MVIILMLELFMLAYGTDHAVGQVTTMSQSGCSYTFLVPKQEDKSCPVGSVESGSNAEEIVSLKSTIRSLQEQMLMLSQTVRHLQEGNKDQKTSGNVNNGSVGANYVRWGRTSCPETAQLVYQGYSANSHYNHKGSGGNYLCLTNDPQWRNETSSNVQRYSGMLYGVEYQDFTVLNSSLHNKDAPCAVCQTQGRVQQLMIPGRMSCPQNWTKEYEGILVSNHHGYYKTEFICLDSEPESIPGGDQNHNGGLFYEVQAACGSLPCPPYVSGYGVSCVVCSN